MNVFISQEDRKADDNVIFKFFKKKKGKCFAKRERCLNFNYSCKWDMYVYSSF